MNKEKLEEMYNELLQIGAIRTRKELAECAGINAHTLYNALNGIERYCTDSLIAKIRMFYDKKKAELVPVEQETTGYKVALIPLEARGGSLAEMAGSCQEWECEKIISPIKGATYAIQVTGDSMYPTYPSGCIVLVKKINERIFLEWGKVYVLDTENGAIIKQLMPSDKADRVRCLSLNKELYPAFEIETKYIKGYYRVLMTMDLK